MMRALGRTRHEETLKKRLSSFHFMYKRVDLLHSSDLDTLEGLVGFKFHNYDRPPMSRICKSYFCISSCLADLYVHHGKI
jgi:hypothetical protein